MPIRTLYVHSVTPRWSHSWQGSKQVFDVLASPAPGPWTLELRTFDAFLASICQRASELGHPLVCGTKDGRGVEVIVTVARLNAGAA